MHLVFVTGNPGKLEEARTALAPYATIEQDPGGYPEIQADTLQEVARAGLDHVGRRRDPPFFLEDAGLFVDALNDFPGVYSAYAYKTLGVEGILRLIKDTPADRRTARFQAVIGYRDPDHNDHLFTGSVAGFIAPVAKGTHGFGFDPIFVPRALSEDPQGKTFAQLPSQEKNEHSHRGAAIARFRHHLENQTYAGATQAAHEKDS